MLIKNNEKEWKRKFAFLPTEINDNGDLVWLSWYECRGDSYRCEYRLPGSNEFTVRSSI